MISCTAIPTVALRRAVSAYVLDIAGLKFRTPAMGLRTIVFWGGSTDSKIDSNPIVVSTLATFVFVLPSKVPRVNSRTRIGFRPPFLPSWRTGRSQKCSYRSESVDHACPLTLKSARCTERDANCVLDGPVETVEFDTLARGNRGAAGCQRSSGGNKNHVGVLDRTALVRAGSDACE